MDRIELVCDIVCSSRGKAFDCSHSPEIAECFTLESSLLNEGSLIDCDSFYRELICGILDSS